MPNPTSRQRAEQIYADWLDEFWVNPDFSDLAARTLIASIETHITAAVAEALDDWGTHDNDCILAQWREGRPTADGGYETLYGYGQQERWYRNKPVDETPPCECGFDAARRRG